MRHVLLSTAAGFALCSFAALAHAQVPTVDPGGGLADDIGGAPPVYGPPRGAPAPAAPAAEPQADEGGGYYHLDDIDLGYDDPAPAGYIGGPVPEHHVVRKGDTLWDICIQYFNNAWEWPRIWSYNPSITNPHWIYPGDLVRLYAAGEAPVAEVEQPDNGDVEPMGVTHKPAPRQRLAARQLAFVDQDQLDNAVTIAGSIDEKMMLSTGDVVYLAYPEGKPPRVGQRHTVYSEQQSVAHPDTGQAVGSYVRILGELEVLSVQQGKRARAVLTEAVDVIERGHLVGPVLRTFTDVPPAPNQQDLEGTIVALLTRDHLIGTGEVVFVDLGSDAGVVPGNRLYVIRRGDAYSPVMRPGQTMGQNDPNFPARALGEIAIVQTGKNLSVGIVTMSMQEMGPGDQVVMRRSR